MKHTPGPWTTAEGPTYCAVRTDARVIANMRLVGLHYNKADAALIAAAPDLLEALQGMLLSFSLTQNPDAYPSDAPCNKARAAIAKATGAA